MASSPRTASRKPARAQVIHKPHGTIHPRVQAVGPGALRHRLRRLRQGPLQVDARRLLRPRPRTPHRRRAYPGRPPGHGPDDPRGRRPGRHRRPHRRHRADRALPPPRPAGLRRRRVRGPPRPPLRPPSSSASPPTPATRPTTPTWRPSTAPRSTASACSSPPAEPDYARLQLLARHRRDLVDKAVGAPLPDPRTSQYDHARILRACFDDVFDAKSPLLVARRLGLGRRDPRRRPGRPDRAAPRGRRPAPPADPGEDPRLGRHGRRRRRRICDSIIGS